jgi:PAS domain S-box-containing protein
MKDESSILVIDNHPGNVRKLKTQLKQQGYLVHSASTGTTALASVRRQPPNLILLEAMEEGREGLETLRRLRCHVETLQIPILFMAAESPSGRRAEALKLGAADFIPVPHHADELTARIRLHIQLAQSRSARETRRPRVETPRQEPKERFRVVADSPTMMFWMTGVDKLCTFVDAGWLRFTGRTFKQELGNGWTASLHPEDAERVLRTYCKAFDAREDFETEYRLRRFDGEYRWVLDKGTARFDAAGGFEGYIGSVSDLREARQNRDQMLATQKLESLGTLANGIAQDFSNLLGCILADADGALMELPRNTTARDAVGRIETVAVRASEIVRQMMTYAGQAGVDQENVDVRELVRGVHDLLQLSIPAGGELRVDLPRDLPTVQANAPQIRQVIMNLVLNSAEAIEGRGGFIRISGRKAPPRRGSLYPDGPAGDWLCLEVSDDGIGIAAENQSKIFDPFFTTKASGRGQGLTAVNGIVRSHGGTVEVKTALGRGTTFRVFLPCAGKVPGKIAAPIEALCGPGVVLLVEDEDTLRRSVAEMLRRRGFGVLDASDGELAVEMIRDRSNDIAVVLLDLTLPGLSSREVFDELRAHRPAAKVILTSAYAPESETLSLASLMREDFIRKPYQLSELAAAIRSAFQPEKAIAAKVH